MTTHVVCYVCFELRQFHYLDLCCCSCFYKGAFFHWK